jgi:hypothetical protein
MFTQSIGRWAALHVPRDSIAAARTNAAVPSGGRVLVTVRRNLTAMPFKIDAP